MKLKMFYPLVVLCSLSLEALEDNRLEEEQLSGQLREHLSFQKPAGIVKTDYAKAKKRPRPPSLEAIDSLVVFPPSFPNQDSLVKSPSNATLSAGIPNENLALMALVTMKFFSVPSVQIFFSNLSDLLREKQFSLALKDLQTAHQEIFAEYQCYASSFYKASQEFKESNLEGELCYILLASKLGSREADKRLGEISYLLQNG